MKKELTTQYDPSTVEDRIYQFWTNGGYFRANVNPDKKPYTVVMPPPNITGNLHMGHALDNTLQDILVRWRRMQGYEALWQPGTDHASIATEARVVEAMRQEGLTKEAIGREKFLDRAWAWKEKYGGIITSQLKRIGTSCDWERERFTLDEGLSKAVVEAFNTMYEEGLIYRGERLINWCPSCLTSISDIEVEHEDRAGHLWHIRYPLVKEEGYLELATTRPETLLGDTAVAVNPEDQRYKHLIGTMVHLPLTNREIPVIADEYVDMEFGTGVVKITPAHDPNDFEVGERHDLPLINIMNEDASINENGGKYQGLSREAARDAVVKDLKEQDLLAKVEDYENSIGTCQRCHSIVEPRMSEQWFVKMQPLAQPAIEAVKNGEVRFVPKRFERSYFNWMENTRDWCISRQLWWGHQIPAWHCENCGEYTVSRTTPDKCSHCESDKLVQDPDTLDTWFSSALWPFSTLGWPEDTPEMGYFYPTSDLITGYDILGFWVSRMIFSGIEHTGQVPFNTVFLHGMVLDEQGRKMSKSLDNGIDPLEVIDEYGADAMRFMLASGNTPGNDMRYSTERITSYRNFANKIWNATRYVLMNIDSEIVPDSLPEELTLEDRWILGEYNALIGEVTHHLEQYEIGLATHKLYEFIWDIYCDWYIEITKARISQGGDTALEAQQVLVYVLDGILRLLHPFMPFITEELWQAIPHRGESIMISTWPEAKDTHTFEEERKAFQIVLDAIRAIRTRRSEMNVPPSREANVFIETAEAGTFSQGVPFIKRLAFASQVEIGNDFSIEGAVQVITDAARIFIPMEDLVDFDKEIQRLEKEKEDIQKDIDFLSGKLSNDNFVSRAPEEIVQGERDKLKVAEDRMKNINDSIADMESMAKAE